MRELIHSFSGGEVSPLLAGRADLPGLRRMARRMRGFIAHPTGPAMRRPSLLHAAMAAGSAAALIPFNAGTGARFVIELFAAGLRVYPAGGGALVTELAAPWTADQIARVQFVQSNDVMWLVHPDVPVQELQRTPAGWTLNEMPWEWPPLRTENLGAATLTPSAVSGVITLEASEDVFEPEHVGAFWQISHFRDVVAAELTVDVTPPASVIMNITDLPTNGQTWTIGNITYRWRTVGTLAQPYDLELPLDAEDVRDSMFEVITTGDSTIVNVQPGTLPHPTVTAEQAGLSTGSTTATAVLTINVGPVNGVTFTNLFASSTVTIAGVTMTAVSSGAGAGQFNLGATQEATLDNIRTAFNAVSGTTGVSFDARQGRSITARATAAGVAGNSIAVSRFSGNPPIQNWLRWTDSSGADTTTLKNGSAADTYRLKVIAKDLGETDVIPVADTMDNAAWAAAQLSGGTETDAVSESVTIKGAWNFSTLGRWQGIVYIERQDVAGNWQIVRQFNGRLDVNRTAEGFAETPTVFRIRVKDLAGAETSDVPNPRFILEAAEALVHGLVQITAPFVDATHANATVISALHSTDAAPNWREGAFSDFRGYPGSVALHEERLIFAGVRSEPQKIWGSGAGDFRDFEETGLADGSWQWPFTSQQAHPIQWLISARGLAIGTAGNERVWDSGDLGITPQNPPLQRQLTFFGSESVMPAGAGDVVVFVQKGGRAVREYTYEFASQSYVAPDLSQLVEHLMQSGVRCLAVQRNPFSIIWAVTNGGTLLACTYERKEEVVGWCPQNVDGTVISVACVQGDVGEADAVWIAVERAGSLRLERFDPDHWNRVAVIPMPITDRVVHLDAAATGTVSSGALTGLGHLEGQAVKIVVAGVPQADQTVSGGQVAVDADLNGETAIAGLAFTSEFQPALFDTVTQSGSSVGKKYVVKKVNVRFYQTCDGKYRNDESGTAYQIKFRTAPAESSEPPAIYNGMTEIQVNGKFLDGISTVIFTDSVHPLNILNLVPEFELYGT